jgi:hypothetical protein
MRDAALLLLQMLAASSDVVEDAQCLAYRSNGTGSAPGLVGTFCDEHAPDDLCVLVMWSIPGKGDATVCVSAVNSLHVSCHVHLGSWLTAITVAAI